MDADTAHPIIFILDDDQGLVRLLNKCLLRADYSVFQATSGREAINWFKSHKADLLLLDLRLPDITREELLTQLVEVHHIPFVVITGQGDERVAVEMMKKGAMDYLVKDGNFLEYVPIVVERALKQSQQKAEHKRLEQEILQISERERQRIGHDLHDGLGQYLTGIELMSSVLEQSLELKNKAASLEVAKITEHLRKAIFQTRMLARGLSPVELAVNGLSPALEELAASTSELFRVSCHFEDKDHVLVDDSTVSSHLYRIAQEAITNALRHGKAKEIKISLQSGKNHSILQVENDGQPFPNKITPGSGMGLRVMRYRAAMIHATLDIQSGEKHGTIVKCIFPKSSTHGS
jgi:signal transduction histidine kinase